MRVTVSALQERDVAPASEIYREAFRAFLNIPDKMMGDAEVVGPRFKTFPEGALAAHLGADLVGTNFVARWGSVAVYGPVTTRTRGWTGGAGNLLMEAGLGLAQTWEATLDVCFTFAFSPDHVRFFEKVGFLPRFLTQIMAMGIRKGTRDWLPRWRRFSAMNPQEQADALKDCTALADEIYPGLSLENEIRGIERLRLGDTIVIDDGSSIVGFAVCHSGAGTEAGSNVCYVKFGCVRSGSNAEPSFGSLLAAVEAYAASLGLGALTIGMNTSHREAHAFLLGKGFHATLQGVALHRKDDPGYSRPGIWVADDWR